MMKIFISVNYLKDIGGIGTAAINLINEIHNFYSITLCCPSDFISPKYRIPNNVKIIRGSSYLRDVVVDRKDLSNQNICEKIRRNIRRVLNHYIVQEYGIEKALRTISVPDEYDVAIAFGDFRYSKKTCKCFDYDLVLNNVRARKKIAWIHNEPIKLGWTHELAIDRLSSFDVIVNVSKYCKRIFDSIVPEFKEKSYVVYNMYNLDKIIALAQYSRKIYSDNRKIHFVTVARIQKEQKRIDRIIETCKRLKEENIDNFDWTLVGTSPQLQELKRNVSDYNLKDIIIFAGLQTNPYPYMKQADAFILSSEFEGYGMTIKESQILETPTFATNFGPAKEAIICGIQGDVCDNSTDGLYTMVKSLLIDRNLLKIYKEKLLQNPVDNTVALSQFQQIVNI